MLIHPFFTLFKMKNHIKKNKIESISDLVKYLINNPSIYVCEMDKILPCAVVINWSLCQLINRIKYGGFYAIERKSEIQKKRIKKTIENV